MKIVVELLKLGLNRDLESGQIHRLVYQYMNERATANKCSWRTEDGAKTRMLANELETKLKPVVTALANIDSSLYYPTRVEGRVSKTDKGGKVEYLTILDREGMYKYLINKLGETNEK